MDSFKKIQHEKSIVGGIYCACCNPFFGKSRKVLNRVARRVLRQRDKKEILKVDEEGGS
jgi:hypothetical protein